MTLQQLFDECLCNPESPLRTNDRDDFTVAGNSLRAFLGEDGRSLDDTDILEIATPGWADRYFEFLFTSYKSNKTRNGDLRTEAEKLKWATRYLKSLRKIVNHAIRHGLMPNIDCLCGIERLPDFARKQGVEEPDSVADTLRSLAAEGLRPAPETKPKAGGSPAALPSPAAESEAGHIFGPSDLYLLCLYCGGMEPAEFCSSAPAAASSAAQTIRLEWAGIDVKLPKNVATTLAEYVASERFGRTSPSAIDIDMKRAGRRLFRGRSIFADWLRYARERHLDDLTIKRLAALRFSAEKQCTPELHRAIQTVVDSMATACNRYRKQWYCIVSHKGTAAARFDELSDICHREQPVVPMFDDRRNDFYFLEPDRPGAPKSRRATSPATVLRRYLFVCLYAHETELLRQHLADIRFLRSPKGSKTYATIPYHEMYKLQLVLEALKGTDATLCLDDEEVSRAIDATPLALREKVTIARPGYETFEAEVIRVGANDRYTVRFPNLNWHLTMADVPRALIHRHP